MDQPASLFALGNGMMARGQTGAAIDAFRRCLSLAPNHAGCLYNLGNALRQAGKPVEAVDSFLGCLRIVPDFSPAYVNLADTLRHLGMLEQAEMVAQESVQRLPDLPEAWICLANVLHDRAEYERAAALYTEALARSPHHAGALTSLGNTLHALGRLTDALEAHDRAVAAEPDNPDFHFNRATARLAVGDFTGGWEDYEWRRQRPQCTQRGFGEPWRGEDITGQTILLHADQGLGDTLQFVRYAPMVAARGCRVVLEVQPSLVRLLRGLPGVAAVVARGDALPKFDANCPLLSLPRAFATTLSTIPAGNPYLHADPEATDAWRTRLPPDGLRVGLVWAGASHRDDVGSNLIDSRRSIAVSALASLADISGVHLVSLQKHEPGLSQPPCLPLIDPMGDVSHFADTAALVANLDLVITVDTSVAHLAGGMGRPVWLLSRADGCWRWLHHRDDSPWYPTMRIYRQERPYDWGAVIAHVHQDLAARSAAPRL